MKFILMATLAAMASVNVLAANIDHIPPGLFKSQVQNLPPQAQERVLENLERFQVPTIDIENLRVSSEGDLLYVDPAPIEDTPTEAVGMPPGTDVFKLHSRPGSSNILYLDFDGADLTNTSWNYYDDNDTIAKPYDTARDGPAFSDEELVEIYNIWLQIREDYEIFDVDVTTETPATFTETTGMVLFTDDTDMDGDCIYACGWGGVAWVGSFGTERQLPCLVFVDNLRGEPQYISVAGSHEAGHTLGLSHDGAPGASYYKGHGEGNISWAPIMGNGYYNSVVQWSKGEYDGANNQQDDIQIIAGYLGFVADDYSAAIDAPASGVITPGDTDEFNVSVGELGWLEVHVIPAWFGTEYTEAHRKANLDIELSVVYPTGETFIINPADDTEAYFGARVPPGTYGIQIANSDSINYSDYNSHGRYYIVDALTPGNQSPQPSYLVCPDNYGAVYIERGKSQEVYFDASASYDVDGTVVGYEWFYGGVSQGTDVSLVLDLEEGFHTVGLTVTDNEGASSSTSFEVEVRKATGKYSKTYKTRQESCP